jgi:putative ABC transport system ATP-binding protein
MVLLAAQLQRTFQHGGVAAVRGVSLVVERGESVAITGPSGSGKSTLLNLLAGLDRPDRGSVHVDGIGLAGLSDDALIRLRRTKIGLVFQFFNLLPLLSARENVSLPLLLAGADPDFAEARAEALLARMGLAARADHMPEQLSGGEMQRVAVARALAPAPVLLLADEPTGNLDSRAGATVLELLTAAAREDDCALLLITHDPRAAAAVERVIEFADGTIVGEQRRPPPNVGRPSAAPLQEGSRPCGI